jgi:hypothetical protein
MKTYLPPKCRLLSVLGLLLLLTASFTRLPYPVASCPTVAADSLDGAWRLTSGFDGPAGTTAAMVIADGRFTVAFYSQAGKKFEGTYGGTCTASGGRLSVKADFNTFDSARVGQSDFWAYRLQNGKWQLSGKGSGGKGTETWEKLDEKAAGTSLAGAWQIRLREDPGGRTAEIKPGPRQTIKFLSATRFQWVAFNNETRQFFATGGGTYTAKDGKYTETIEFFSRDPNRVGMQLSFDYALEGARWRHSGKSSTGNRVNEVWVREGRQ